MNKNSCIFVILNTLLFLIITQNALTGTFRDDFENKQDFLADKQVRVGGVWGEDIDFYTWEKGAIKGNGVGFQFFHALITGENGFGDYAVECKVIPLIIDEGNSESWFGLVLRRPCIDCDIAYYFVLTGTNNIRIDGINGAKLAESHFELEMNKPYILKAIVQDNRLEFYVNNELLLKIKDSSQQAGKAGIIVWKSMAMFDDFVMTGPDVKDGGHWNDDAHPKPKVVESKSKITFTWGRIKYNNW